ncbi:MAG TPA: DUF3105 domain-containing protein [Solirubrobacteraceae bacterium]|jgi:hypothetical protein
MSRLERAAVILASLVLSFGLIAFLSGFFRDRDNGQLAGSSGGPGRHFRDLGDVTLRPGQLRPAYDSSPPTSGSHVLAVVTRDRQPLSDDQLLTALALGDVVIMYGGDAPPAALVRLADTVAGPFTPVLAAAGQAVILSRSSGLGDFVGLAWTEMIRVKRAADPLLTSFASYWLGRGAVRAGGS